MTIRLASIALGLAALAAGAPPAAPSATAVAKNYPYLLDTCPISGHKLGSMGDPVVKQIDGREVRFCCDSCIAKFESDKAAAFKKIDADIIKSQLPHYPLKTCVVVPADELKTADQVKPGDHCEVVDYVYHNRLVRFCCDGCIEKFSAAPDQYLAKLDEAVIQQQLASYPLDTCPIAGEKLDDSAVNYVAGVSLIRFCCKDCIKKFEKDPIPTLSKLHDAWKAKMGDTHEGHDHARPDGADHQH